MTKRTKNREAENPTTWSHYTVRDPEMSSGVSRYQTLGEAVSRAKAIRAPIVEGVRYGVASSGQTSVDIRCVWYDETVPAWQRPGSESIGK